jgi:predicted nucleotidyltransferase component of viral defense system
MSWENSSASTPLKRDFLKSFFVHEKRFFLTGGSALGLFYLQHRFSYDLDLFSKENVEWLEVDGVIHLCAKEIGADLDLLRDTPTFRRYRVCRDGLTEIIDIVFDLSPQVDTEKAWIEDIQVDTLHEIMLNKIATLISRCELKDVVDLYFMEQEGLRVETYFEEAQQKDGGLDPSMISLLLNSLAVPELPSYMIKPLTLEALRAFVDDLKRHMALMAYPDTP